MCLQSSEQGGKGSVEVGPYSISTKLQVAQQLLSWGNLTFHYKWMEHTLLSFRAYIRTVCMKPSLHNTLVDIGTRSLDSSVLGHSLDT